MRFTHLHCRIPYYNVNYALEMQNTTKDTHGGQGGQGRPVARGGKKNKYKI